MSSEPEPGPIFRCNMAFATTDTPKGMSFSVQHHEEEGDQNTSDEDHFATGDRLKKVKVTLSPERSPDHLAQPVVSPSSARFSKRTKRKKLKASVSDSYLLSWMAPNRPDIAKDAGTRTLVVNSPSPSGDESMPDVSDIEEEEEDLDTRLAREMEEKEVDDLEKERLAAQRRVEFESQRALDEARDQQNRLVEEEKRRIEEEARELQQQRERERIDDEEMVRVEQEKLELERTAQLALAQAEEQSGSPTDDTVKSALSNGGLYITVPNRSKDTFHPPLHTNGLQTPQEPRRMSLSHHQTSPQSAYPQQDQSADRKLPALQSPGTTDGPGSPQSGKLPGFANIAQIAEKANGEISRQRQQSISTMSAPSPYAMRSPHAYSFTHPSPVASETSPRGMGMTSPHAFYPSNRRPSVAGDYPNGMPSASSTDNSYASASTDGYSPSTNPTPQSDAPHRLSIDGAMAEGRPILPPPIPSVQHLAISAIPPHGLPGGFTCDFPGCTAQAFQTQYLLNSHANVHSSNRPHFCPVATCPRGPGGKGFKRKNEMIRHGLVHDSPGYVCPFCPDREHKYPRPDNLQRHVRVHHVEVSKEDPQLRSVLAQRPEGGNRGRRRRLGS
ncbi:Serine/threonine-protein phosphatase 2A activator 1 [Venturia inaequalis]|nr:Serine/threonine-protein phosphatase 2A activator 1 [Venturia inaequalis]